MRIRARSPFPALNALDSHRKVKHREL
jgi:hypothetical protein